MAATGSDDSLSASCKQHQTIDGGTGTCWDFQMAVCLTKCAKCCSNTDQGLDSQLVLAALLLY